MKKLSENINKKIKVCFVCPKAYPLFDDSVEGVFGGAEVDLYLLGRELARDDSFDVSFIVADYGQASQVVIDNVRLVKGIDFAKNSLSGAWSLWQSFKKVNADIYMLKTASPGVPLASWFCRLHAKHFIYRTASQAESNGQYRKDKPVLGMLFERALKKASIVFSQNKEDQIKLQDRCNIESIVIPNGHRITNNDIAPGDEILWVGRSDKVKAPEKFITLAQKNPNRNFTMICPRATNDNNYQSLIEAADNVANLKFIKNVPFAQIDQYFINAAILVNTSVSEGFANVFIQACKHGVPILTLDVNPDNFLNEHICGICCDGDFEMMSPSLKLLTDDLHDSFSQNAFDYVNDVHDIRKIIKQYKTFFRELI